MVKYMAPIDVTITNPKSGAKYFFTTAFSSFANAQAKPIIAKEYDVTADYKDFNITALATDSCHRNCFTKFIDNLNEEMECHEDCDDKNDHKDDKKDDPEDQKEDHGSHDDQPK